MTKNIENSSCNHSFGPIKIFSKIRMPLPLMPPTYECNSSGSESKNIHFLQKNKK